MTAKPDVRMSRAEVDRFIAEVDIAFLAFRLPDGTLRARPVRYDATGGALSLREADGIPLDASAFAIVDSYPAYDKIKGALLRGTVQDAQDGPSLMIDRASGFDFAKTGQS